MQVWSLGQKDPQEEGMATHSSILAWRIPMDRGAWRAAVHALQGVRHNWSNLAHNPPTIYLWHPKTLSFNTSVDQKEFKKRGEMQSCSTAMRCLLALGATAVTRCCLCTIKWTTAVSVLVNSNNSCPCGFGTVVHFLIKRYSAYRKGVP